MASSIHLAGVAGIAFAAGAAAMLLGGQLAQTTPQSPPSAPAAPPHSYAGAVARAAPAVVSVYGRHAAAAGDGASTARPEAPAGPMPGQAREPAPVYSPAPAAGMAPVRPGGVSLGSGVLVSADGLIVTSGHTIKGASEISIGLPGGRMLDVESLGIDPETDLAVLQAAERGLPAVELAKSADLRVGDVVLAIGNPFGLSQTVSLGIVSAIGRTQLGLTGIEDFVQTDAAINPGNSGGALIDADGRLVGINTAIMSESGLSEGVGFAIPADIVMDVVDAIVETGTVERGWIGIAGSTLTPELARRYALRAPHGVLILRVDEDSPAARADLRAGDVVSHADGRDLRRSRDLREAVTAAGAGGAVKLDIWRGSERLRARLVTEQRPLGGVRRQDAESAVRHRTGLSAPPASD
jgi:serine protease DegS